jgi:hypothetical protein
MANVKITDFTSLSSPDITDVLAIVDVDVDVTKKVSVGEIVGKISGDVSVATDGTSSITAGAIVNADISASAEIAVSKLADGAARQLLQTDSAGTGVEWTDNIDLPGTLDVTGAATFDQGVTIAGDLTVNGTTTTVNSTTITVDDKNIELGSVTSPTDTTADGGGITLKGATDKTINWVNATDAWTSSEHVELASGKEFYINGNSVLNATTLGSGVTTSSLTAVGTIGTGTWEATAIDATYLDSTVVTTSDTGTVTSAMLANGTIVDEDIDASAAIVGTKIDPDFGAQNVETTGDLDINTGLLKVASGSSAIGFFSATPASQPSAIADITSTATSGALPTPDGSITIADATTPTVTELLEYCVELESKLETALAALRALGLIAT